MTWIEDTPPSAWAMTLDETWAGSSPSFSATRTDTSPLLARKAACSRLIEASREPDADPAADPLSRIKVLVAW